MSDNSKVAPLDVGPIRGQMVDAAGAVQFDSGALPASDILIGDETIVVSQIPDVPGAIPVGVKVSLLQLRYWMSGQFGVRLQSAGDAASPAHTSILLETSGASPTNPYLVYFDQLLITPFTGGQFDLVERDASDLDLYFSDCITVDGSPLLASVGDDFTADMVDDIVTMVGVPPGTTVLSYQNPKQVTMSANATASAPDPGISCAIGGKTQVTIATKTGFTTGDTTGTWSRLVKAITSDKIYSVIFVPGTAGDGIYSMNASGLSRGAN